jgi:CO/xanthine dehydrogenase Mo-binding subunit
VIGQKLVYDAQYGVAIGKRMYQNKPPTMLDIPIDAQAEGLNIPDPGNPVVGAKGIGEPGIGVGGVVCPVRHRQRHRQRRHLMRTPVQPEQIMTSLQQGRVAYEPLTAYI